LWSIISRLGSWWLRCEDPLCYGLLQRRMHCGLGRRPLEQGLVDLFELRERCLMVVLQGVVKSALGRQLTFGFTILSSKPANLVHQFRVLVAAFRKLSLYKVLRARRC
jgi:hypothetical protein